MELHINDTSKNNKPILLEICKSIIIKKNDLSNFINIIVFLNIYALFGLLLTPIIWIIVKSFLLSQKVILFQVFLLEKIDYDAPKNEKTPLWLVIFRIFFYINSIILASLFKK